MLLILTNSYDGTIDLLVLRLPKNSFFRLNCDLVDAYEIEVTNDGFSISDKSGRKITSDQVQKLYYRKLWNNSDDNQSTFSRFQYEEMRYLITEIVNLLWIKNKIVLVEPHAERRCGKLIQLMVAKNYFATPTWGFSYRKIAKTSKALQM